MRVPSLINCAVIFAALLFATSAAAQLSPSEKTSAIQTIAKHIAENYVDQSLGGQIASHLLLANHKGEFRKAADWMQFDELVTRSMQKFSGDEHLYVKYDPEMVKDLKTSASDSQQMNIGERPEEGNYGFSEARIVGNNIGYIKLTQINITEKSLPVLYSTMEKMEGTDALIVDLRDNSGGGSEVGPVLESFFLPAGTPLLEFISRAGTQTIDSSLTTFDKKRYGKPLYILINRGTASAAEAFAFVMKNQKRAKIIGETSAGAANRNDWFVVNESNYLSVSTASTSLPGTRISWEKEGVQPDHRVKGGDALEYTLKTLIRS